MKDVEVGGGPSRQASHHLVPAVLLVAVTGNAAMVPLLPYLLATRVGWSLWQVGLYSFAVTWAARASARENHFP